jgi:hypothetical protein
MDTRYDGPRLTYVYLTKPRNMPFAFSAQPIMAVLRCARDLEIFLCDPKPGSQTWWGDPSSKEGQNRCVVNPHSSFNQSIGKVRAKARNQKQGLSAKASL